MNKLKILPYLLVIIFPYSHADQFHDMGRKLISEMAAGLPVNLDRYTTMTGILLQPDKVALMSYTYDVELEYSDEAIATNKSVEQLKSAGINKYGSYDSMIKAWGEFKRNAATKNLCTNPESLALMNRGYTYKHLFHDTNGNFLYSYSINIKSC